MRFLIINLLALGSLVLFAATASAFEITWDVTTNGGTPYAGQGLDVSDTVTLSIYLDADQPGIGFIAVAVLWDSDESIFYAKPLSSMPSYLLYSGGKGATYLIPNVNPPNLFPGTPPPGKGMLLVEYLEQSFSTTVATGLDLWIADIVFHVAAANDTQNTVELSWAPLAAFFEVNAVDISSQVPIPAPVVLQLPEPASLGLSLAALVTLAAVGMRRRRS